LFCLILIFLEEFKKGESYLVRIKSTFLLLVFQRFGVSTFIENSPFATSDDSKGGISEELSPIPLHPKNESAKMKPRFSGSPIKEAWKTANEVKT
jgi:hypothetical protein